VKYRRARKPGQWLIAILCTAACVNDADDTTKASPESVPVFAGPAEILAPGSISDNRWQWRITFTPDGDTAYFAVSDDFFPASRRATIVTSHRRQDGTWSTPSVAPFSGTYSDIDPFITPDGSRLYFSSIRPLNGRAKPDLDLFYVERTADGWTDPVRLGPEVNSDLDELYASATSDGTLFFGVGPSAPTPDADWDIYHSRPTGGGFAPREAVAEINTDLSFDTDDPTADWEFNPEISPDGRTLIFTSLRPGGFGRGDLYITRYDGTRWSEPVNLGAPVNTSDDEFHPVISRDGRTLYFGRTIFEPVLVPGDLYHVPIANEEQQ